METVKVFVYGTLRKGNQIRGMDLLNPDAKFIGSASTVYDEYSLYDLGSFPAVTDGGVHNINGEVWEVPVEMLETTLDSIEGYPDFYNRRIVQTTLGPAWMYYMENVSSMNALYVEAPVGKTVEWTDITVLETEEF